MKTVILIFVCIMIIVFGLGSFYLAIKEKAEKKELQNKYENMIKGKEKDDEQKEKLQNKINQHSNHTDNVLESLDLLHNRKS